MGTAKGGLAHPDGGTLLSVALHRLRPWARVRVVAGRGTGEQAPAGIPWLRDPPGLRGPLAGVAAAARAFPADYYLLLAVDMPAARPELLVAAARRRPGRTVIGQTPDGRWQPLAGVYPAAHVRRAWRLLRRGERRATVWAAEPPRPPVGVRGPWWLNVNTPAEAAHHLPGVSP
jgi:molybdopterin-guanine dinucleotide biosynthesis protein A